MAQNDEGELGALKGCQPRKVDETAPLVLNHQREGGLEQEEGPLQLHLDLPLSHRKGHGTETPEIRAWNLRR
jgi:hypothetical protein